VRHVIEDGIQGTETKNGDSGQKARETYVRKGTEDRRQGTEM
jgi:hypothetical protein